MKNFRLIMMSLLFSSCLSGQVSKLDFVLVIHGGAGAIKQSEMSPENEALYRAGLQEALDAGATILAGGGQAEDAVEATIRLMEDNPMFNAGRGAVLTNRGTAELDASFMSGKSNKAGSVAGVKTVRHPISAARRVMDSSVHVMFAGEGADQFAAEKGLEIVENSFFYTETRLQQLRALLNPEENENTEPLLKKHGTVGCVALDKSGNLAAGTSTGGMMNKRYGRVGDAPIIGAGTYANNRTCAVSCTGHGEYFIRNVIAYDVSALMEYGQKTLQEAADYVIHHKLSQSGGTGGLIALDREGNIAMPFNTDGMFRAFIKSNGETGIEIYGNPTDGK
ncbi:MAG: isoaspartyl peptidase/L-asparaginase [Bacteroidia bacterium]|nr:isoaspartyl peptidase/L-asparaginase [Bacteroidia bacterium]